MTKILEDKVTRKDSYYSNERREMLPFIPESVSQILEIGCDKGEFARFLKQQREVVYWGWK